MPTRGLSGIKFCSVKVVCYVQCRGLVDAWVPSHAFLVLTVFCYEYQNLQLQPNTDESSRVRAVFSSTLEEMNRPTAEPDILSGFCMPSLRPGDRNAPRPEAAGHGARRQKKAARTHARIKGGPSQYPEEAAALAFFRDPRIKSIPFHARPLTHAACEPRKRTLDQLSRSRMRCIGT